jgi:hypothetical protein
MRKTDYAEKIAGTVGLAVAVPASRAEKKGRCFSALEVAFDGVVLAGAQ